MTLDKRGLATAAPANDPKWRRSLGSRRGGRPSSGQVAREGARAVRGCPTGQGHLASLLARRGRSPPPACQASVGLRRYRPFRH